ncbi:unnamed protein product [Cylicocyclus nassatus]|uniref:Uncharacterized protein n=1 Tax=Cylicocyclus nassatus TaxID=53992 RepID=A0AA36MCV2_CYLNA|nr:unnamed protein product [Cylicocyclus nassatus]
MQLPGGTSGGTLEKKMESIGDVICVINCLILRLIVEERLDDSWALTASIVTFLSGVTFLSHEIGNTFICYYRYKTFYGNAIWRTRKIVIIIMIQYGVALLCFPHLYGKSVVIIKDKDDWIYKGFDIKLDVISRFIYVLSAGIATVACSLFNIFTLRKVYAAVGRTVAIKNVEKPIFSVLLHRRCDDADEWLSVIGSIKGDQANIVAKMRNQEE